MGALLAEDQLAGRLQIKPEAAFSASEVLTQAAREKMASAFGRQPFNVYAATETAGIASECEQHSGLHLYEDLVITEFVDEKNCPVPPGTYGARVLVTVLFNKTQPLIRYEMSDRVAPSAERCPCGRPFALIAGIEGRAEDILRMRSAEGADVIVHPLVFHRILDATPSRGWQIVQTGERAIKLILANEHADPLALQGALRRALTEAGVSGANIEVDRVAEIPRTALGKLRLVVRQ